jgi:hypothetical protein
MTSPTEKSFCVIEYTNTNSCTSVQRTFRKRFHTNLPPRASIQRWSDNFENHGCICKKKSSGPPRVSDEAIRHMEATFSRSPKKSVQMESCELQMPKATVWQVLCTRIRVKPYKFTMIQKLEPEDCLNGKTFARRCHLALPFSLHVTSLCGVM